MTPILVTRYNDNVLLWGRLSELENISAFRRCQALCAQWLAYVDGQFVIATFSGPSFALHTMPS